jgi:hypothetical protein
MNEVEEIEVINSVESGEWASIPNLDAMKEKLAQAAVETAMLASINPNNIHHEVDTGLVIGNEHW